LPHVTSHVTCVMMIVELHTGIKMKLEASEALSAHCAVTPQCAD
jgi:hypothetical protein